MKVLIMGQIVLWKCTFTLDDSVKSLFNSVDHIIITIDNALVDPYAGTFFQSDALIDHSIRSDLLKFLPLQKCVFILANNHVTDYGVQGIRNWDLFCKNNSVRYVGLKQGPSYVDVDQFRLFAISSNKNMSKPRYQWIDDEVYQLTEDTLKIINKNIDKQSKTNIMFWHDHLNIDPKLILKALPIDIVIKTGDPYPLLTSDKGVVSGLGSFIFESKKLDHYDQSINLSYALLLDTDNVDLSSLITFLNNDRVVSVIDRR